MYFLAPELWMEYILFCIGLGNTDATRELINRAISSSGMHTAEGSLVWNTLRELELSHLALLEPGSEEWKKQLGKVIDAFKRQLSVPLLQMEDTYEELKQWIEQLPAGKYIFCLL